MDEQAMLSRRERQIMDIVYSLKEASVNRVLEAMPDRLSRVTVRTMLRILEEKGHLKHSLSGREFVYRPVRPRRRVGQSAMRRLVETFFDGSLAEAVGAHISKKIDIPARDAGKILDAVSYLRQTQTGEPPRLGRRVAVYGGGNTAMDAARTAKRLGAEEAMIIYRRDRASMPAHDFEADEALEEGVKIKWLRTIKEIDQTTFQVEVMELDENGRPQPTGRLETRRRLMGVSGAVRFDGTSADRSLAARRLLVTTFSSASGAASSAALPSASLGSPSAVPSSSSDSRG